MPESGGPAPVALGYVPNAAPPPPSLTWVEGGRAVLHGIDNDYSEGVGLTPPVDLLAGGPDWLPWEWLIALISNEVLGFVYWWADGAWGRAPYPDDLREDGLTAIVPADDSEVRAVLDALTEDGADAAVIAVAMRAAVELPRPAPAESPALARLVAWLRANHPQADGRCLLAAAFSDSADSADPYGVDGFHDEQGRRLGAEVSALLGELRQADADASSGRWMYVRVQVTADGVTVDRAHDHLPGWWGARYGTHEARPETLAREMASRAPRWRPAWAGLLDEDIPRNGAPAALCRPATAPPPAPSPAAPAAPPSGPSR
ncbi:hypothetical protein [Streptomyces chattanoogensis]|uniref:hypothetical protein n=1 Tax=Streptomyces chattanoogensis TaxID=66876 RepID=UPI00369221DE